MHKYLYSMISTNQTRLSVESVATVLLLCETVMLIVEKTKLIDKDVKHFELPNC